MKKNRLVIGLIVVLVVVVAVVGIVVAKSNKSTNSMSDMNMAMAASSKAVATDAVTVQNYMFSPMTITVKTGTTVTWTNKDSVSHTVTSDSGKELNSPLFGLNQTFKHTFTKAGTYTYYCQVHPYMKATVIVTS